MSAVEGVPRPFLAIWGVCSFLKRPILWVHLFCPVAVTLFSTIISLVVLMLTALPGQSDMLKTAGWPAPLAWLSGFLLVIAEVMVVNLIIMLVLFGCVQSKISRHILEERGILMQIRSEYAQRHLGALKLPEPNCCRDLGHNILFLLIRIPLLIFTLPVNGIPILGQIAWCLLNGWLYAWELEAEFMVMSRELYSCGSQYRFVSDRCLSFFGFGTVAMLLEMIPVAGPWLFFASNACGAALLAESFFLETHRFDGEHWMPKASAPPAMVMAPVFAMGRLDDDHKLLACQI
eukprot:TRINITY_DN59178_c0_g1_i1.p1 TRINITY_DN59178_c0_g1~~TRINITY_DN59178_c0_g1_i1.p1  ORF type:complete len:290 (+),score=38.66 TRINITY_DN59178_c0_g1_i1:20-889(+)